MADTSFLRARATAFADRALTLRRSAERPRDPTLRDAYAALIGEYEGLAIELERLADRAAGGVAAPAAPGNDMQFRRLVEAVIDYAIFMLDPDGRITTWNSGVGRIKGYTADEVVGRHFSMFYTDGDRAAGLPEIALRTATEVGRFEGEGWRVRKDGTTFFASVVIDRILDERGQLIGFAKITRDITERMQAQRELEIGRVALAQAQRMEAVGKLTGGIAHDFNNLLTVIGANVDLLAQARLDDKTRAALTDGVLRATERGARLTQQLLAFSQRQSLQPRQHSIATLIRNVEPLLRRGAGETIEFELMLSDEADVARIDAAQFESALLNVIMNSREAMPRGGTVTIRTAVQQLADPVGQKLPALAPGEYVVVSLADTGEGMTSEVLAHAFEPFYTTREVGKGSGLGLSQVYGFVAQSGGHARLDSAPGTGTTVFLYLPVDETAKATLAARSTAAATSSLGTILLVEDDPDVMSTALLMLRSLGYDVVTAPDGVSALDTLTREPAINILFTDVVMPKGVNGVELARRARELRANLKILLASGYPAAALSAEHGLDEKFAFLSKPYRWGELSERLRDLKSN